MTLAERSRKAAGSLVRGTVGMLPFFEYRLEVARVRSTLALRRRENELVERFESRSGPLPPADVAVVIPTYRRPEGLRAAVDSALAQTVTDLRVVVVDDGAGIDTSLPDDDRLSVLALPENVGVAGIVRNVGIRMSRSRLIAFLDDDNTWEPDHLARALPAHRDGAELTYSSLRRVDGDGVDIDVLGEPFDRRALRDRSLIDTNAIVVRRGDDVIFSRVRRGLHDFPGEDWELAWRLSRRLRVQHLPYTTVRYVCHDGSNYTDWNSEA